MFKALVNDLEAHAAITRDRALQRSIVLADDLVWLGSIPFFRASVGWAAASLWALSFMATFRLVEFPARRLAAARDGL